MVPEALFSVFGMKVHLYGICIAVGILTCFIIYYLYTRHLGLDEDVMDFSFYVIIFALAVGFLSARFFQTLYNWLDEGFVRSFSQVWNTAGITVMGGVTGGALGFMLAYFGGGSIYFKYFKKGKKREVFLKEFNKIQIVAPMCILIAHAFGRIGCLMAGCCHGAFLGKEYVFGGVWMTPVGGKIKGYYVPTQLYEAVFLFVLFGILSLLFFKKKSNYNMYVYLISYGAWRLFIELFRDDYRGVILLNLSPSQWFSIIYIITGLVLIGIHIYKRKPFKYDYKRASGEIKQKIQTPEN